MESLTITLYKIISKPTHCPFYELSHSSISAVSGVPEATFISPRIRVKLSHWVALILDLFFLPLHFISCSQWPLKMLVDILFLCIMSFNRFSFLKLLYKTNKALQNVASFFTSVTLVVPPPVSLAHWFLLFSAALCTELPLLLLISLYILIVFFTYLYPSLNCSFIEGRMVQFFIIPF